MGHTKMFLQRKIGKYHDGVKYCGWWTCLICSKNFTTKKALLSHKKNDHAI